MQAGLTLTRNIATSPSPDVVRHGITVTQKFIVCNNFTHSTLTIIYKLSN